jgi:hypothetical protein
MPRIRWTDPNDDSAKLFGWRLPSLVLATPFLNIYFWYEPGCRFPFTGSLAVFLGSLGTVTVLVPVLFFLGPAFAAHETRQSLFQVAGASFGTGPAVGLRICCAVMCVCWIAGLSATILSWSGFMLRRDLSFPESNLFAGLLMLFLFATGLQSLQTSARLAFFTNKLGAALLIAAAIRVRGYLPDAWSDLGTAGPIADTVWPRIAEPLMTSAKSVLPNSRRDGDSKFAAAR